MRCAHGVLFFVSVLFMYYSRAQTGGGGERGRENQRGELSLLTSGRNGIEPGSRAAAAGPLYKKRRQRQRRSHRRPSYSPTRYLTRVGGRRLEEPRRLEAGLEQQQQQQQPAMEKPRQVVRKFLARPQHEGAGAVVRRSIGR